ncbi:MAG: FIST C-terminal domain-containing protein [Treponema sp.]|nr:FIST C-terminal domain-containing protein [Treponema sp.]
MVNMITAHTGEIDDINAAAADLLAQIGAQGPLKKHSIGLISCFPDFISSGLIAELAGKLPFESAGATTLAGADRDTMGEALLILTVLTSDDLEFVTGLTGRIAGEDPELLRPSYEKASEGRQEKPALMISFAPLLMNVSGDFFAEAWDSITGNVPVFGTVAVDHNTDYHEAQTFLNGETFRDRFVFVLVYGPIKPTFIIGGISENKVFREKGVVTASRGNQLREVNGVSAADYLTSLGLSKDENGLIVGINSFPFILDYNDGAQPVIRVMFAITPEGHAVCGGKVPVGASLTVGSINREEVLNTTGETLKIALAIGESNGNKNGLLIFSCVGRFFAQGFDTTAEMKKARDVLGDKLPFHFAYSGTELCPVYGNNGAIFNRSHNDTIVICIF